uniref:Dynactin subunit 6 n=1 Tax=Parastrongyloides trichosuri TaxID=131310 RepID=A0A0N4ZNJ2_PARTI
MVNVKLNFHENSQVLEKCILSGEITVGDSTVIQPQASILATKGPIIIGSKNIIEEFVVIENLNENGEPLIIGDRNTFEVGSIFKGKSVGNQNLFSVRSSIGSNTMVTDFCSIGTKCSVKGNEILQPFTVVFGENSDRRIGSEKPDSTEDQLEFLLKVFPKYHKILKT